jgi:hypothetical protein
MKYFYYADKKDKMKTHLLANQGIFIYKIKLVILLCVLQVKIQFYPSTISNNIIILRVFIIIYCTILR